MGNYECVFCIRWLRLQIKTNFNRVLYPLGVDFIGHCHTSVLLQQYLSFKPLQDLAEEAALFSGTWIRKYYFTVFSKVLFFSQVSSFIVLLFSCYSTYFILWFHLFVDFCNNWLFQEIKSFRITELLSILC